MVEPIDAETKIEFVKKQACFTQLTPKEIEVLSTLLVEKHFKAGDTIVNEGDTVDSVYLIVKGKADVRHVSIKNGAHHVESVATIGVNDSIGLNETGFYSLSGLRTATVTALTDMTVLYLSVAAFHGFALSYPHVHEVMRINAENLLGIKL